MKNLLDCEDITYYNQVVAKHYNIQIGHYNEYKLENKIKERRLLLMEIHQNTIKTKKHISMTEMLLSPEQHAEKVKNSNVQLISGEQLYKHSNYKIYEHYDEVEIPNDDTQVVLDLITEESYMKLLQSDFAVMLLGLFLIQII